MGLVRLVLLLLSIAVILDGLFILFPNWRSQNLWSKHLNSFTSLLLNWIKKLLPEGAPKYMANCIFVVLVIILYCLW